MKRSRIISLVVLGVILAAIVVGYALHLKQKSGQDVERVVESTEVQRILQKDLVRSYPPTEKEVVKYFADTIKCFYNEEYTEEELEEMALKIQGVYDDELIANKTQEDYMNDLRSEIADMKKKKWTISSYVLSASVDVENFTENGYSCARLYCTFNVKQSTNGTVPSMQEFILRKDENGHWKILGWKLVED